MWAPVSSVVGTRERRCALPLDSRFSVAVSPSCCPYLTPGRYAVADLIHRPTVRQVAAVTCSVSPQGLIGRSQASAASNCSLNSGKIAFSLCISLIAASACTTQSRTNNTRSRSPAGENVVTATKEKEGVNCAQQFVRAINPKAAHKQCGEGSRQNTCLSGNLSCRKHSRSPRTGIPVRLLPSGS